MSRIVGITGGIATGKSHICGELKELGYWVVSCDDIAKYLISYDYFIIKKIIREFPEAITIRGVIDRKELRKIVFTDKDRLEVLNSIIHEPIRRIVLDLICIALDADDDIFIEIPLLFESDFPWTEHLTETWMVSCRLQTQYDRVAKRNVNGLAQAMINAQLPLSDKERKANVVILNEDCDKESLKEKVEAALNHTDNYSVRYNLGDLKV